MIIQVTQGIYIGGGGTTRAIAEKMNYFSKIDNQIFLISVDENHKFDKNLINAYRKRFDLISKIKIIKGTSKN